MKKLIPIFLAVLCLTACGNEQVKNPDTLVYSGNFVLGQCYGKKHFKQFK